MSAPSPQIGLYAHWPYCARICPYCDFNVRRARADDEARALQAAMLNDLADWARRIELRALSSVYIGGGTPSLAAPSFISQLINEAARLFGLAPQAEITLELNPNDAARDRLSALRAAGVNRLSIGAQSFDDRLLAFLGRDHDGASARQAIDRAQTIFERVSFDLIYGAAPQSLDDWSRDLDAALARAPTHLSVYQLTIEPGTPFARARARGADPARDNDALAAYDALAEERAAQAGLTRYEISNYAAPGFEARHNLLYWTYQDYLGVGPGAHGRLTLRGPGGAPIRAATHAPDAISAYIEEAQARAPGADRGVAEWLSAEDQLTERLTLGLRLAQGVALYADDVFYHDEARAARLRALTEEGFLRHDCGRLRATEKGRPVLDRLLYELLG